MVFCSHSLDEATRRAASGQAIEVKDNAEERDEEEEEEEQDEGPIIKRRVDADAEHVQALVDGED